MAPASDINALLRFLAQGAKLALPSAMAAAKNLQTTSLTSAALIASSSLAMLTPMFASPDEAKKVLNAAKRASKRPAGDSQPSPRKKQRLSKDGFSEPEPEELEAALALPSAVTDEDAIVSTVLFTNRAPLLLVFTLVLLEYTMPRQPLSSRLSLAQAQVSQGAKERARDLGIERGALAQEDGWGTGQPIVKVMSKDVRVIRRSGYPLASPMPERSNTQNDLNAVERSIKTEESSLDDQRDPTGLEPVANDDTAKNEAQKADDGESALWALDLEALKKSNTDVTSSSTSRSGGGLPIYSPHSARSYIVKAFASAESGASTKVKAEGPNETSTKPKKAKSDARQKEDNLGLLLGALKMLFNSWADSLDSDTLSRRAWTWYGESGDYCQTSRDATV